MHALLRISRGIDAFTDWVGRQTGWIVTLLIIIGFLNVVARYFGRFVGLRLTSNVIIEAQWYMFSVLFFLGFAYVLRHNPVSYTHLKEQLEQWALSNERVQAFIEGKSIRKVIVVPGKLVNVVV